MQRIFIVEEGSVSMANSFLADGGSVISVTPNYVSSSESSSQRGKWLVVIDDGKIKSLDPLK